MRGGCVDMEEVVGGCWREKSLGEARREKHISPDRAWDTLFNIPTCTTGTDSGKTRSVQTKLFQTSLLSPLTRSSTQFFSRFRGRRLIILDRARSLTPMKGLNSRG